MIKATDIEKGSFVLHEGQPHLVVDRDFYSPGKGSAIVHLKIKNVKNGAFLKVVLKTTDEVEEVEIEHKEVKFLYGHRDSFCFVEGLENKRIVLPDAIVGDDKDFLKPGETYQIVFYENEPISIKVPIKMELLVIEADESAKGNTATGDTKEVVLETGLRVRTPAFINKGDKIIVNTEKREYSERA